MRVEAIQKTGKTVDEAVEEALKELKISREDAEIEVIEEGSRGFWECSALKKLS